MFEVKDRKNPARIGKLAGSKLADGRLFTEEEASRLVEQATCLDDSCAAPLQLVRGTAVRRAHFRHHPSTGEGCGVGSEETAWNLYVTEELLAGAYAHELVIPGARVDAAVLQPSTGRFIVVVEAQHSPISASTIVNRHAAHREAGMASTVWIAEAKRFDSEDRAKTRWVADLITACADTPTVEGSYTSTVAILDLESKRGSFPGQGLRFVEATAVDTYARRTALRVLAMSSTVEVRTVEWWARGLDRAKVPAAIRRGNLTDMDRYATEDFRFTDAGVFKMRWRKQLGQQPQ